MFKFFGSGISYVSNRYKRLLDDNFNELILGATDHEGRIVDLEVLAAEYEAIVAFQNESVWWELDTEVVTTFSAVNTPTLILGSINLFRITEPTVAVPLPNNVLTATYDTGDRFYEAHCLFNITGTGGDVINVYCKHWNTTQQQYIDLHVAQREIEPRPGPLEDVAFVSFYATAGAIPGDTVEFWVENTTSTNSITLKVDSTMRLRAV